MKCKKCGKNKATTRDRNKPWVQRNTICSDCHSIELRGDMINIAKHHITKKLKTAEVKEGK